MTNTSYLVKINDGSLFSRDLNPPDPGLSPVFTEAGYQDGMLHWKLGTSWAYVQCFIYDAQGSLMSRTVWDKLTASGFSQSVDVSFLPFEQDYTARFYAWRPDGGASSRVNLSFHHSCPWLVGDADGSGFINVADASFLIAYIFNGGPAPEPLWAGDADCNHRININDPTYIIGYIFGGGAPPQCTCVDYQ